MSKLIYWPHPILTQNSRRLDVTDTQDYALIQRLFPEMVKVMDDHGGIGLSAVQIGEPVNFVVVRNKKLPLGVGSYINPSIVEHIGEPKLKREGCLSAPGVFEEIRRYEAITLVSETATFIDCDGVRATEVRQKFTGKLAHILQHECEHLAGEFFFKHLSGLRRARAYATLTRTTPH